MQLLNHGHHGELCLSRDSSDNIPPYAILSHTWGAEVDEVTFDDIKDNTGAEKAGYAKIRSCAEQAKKEGLEYIWVDTCCINRANHVQLSEAITSMYRWYKGATVCYAYLADVPFRPEKDEDDIDGQYIVRSWKTAFRKSRWFTRGWTLQELIAPEQVVFFSKEWERLGTKHTLEELIHEITSIPVPALRGESLTQFSVAERLRWTRSRSTKRQEDQAYCLLGMFNVFMPLIYGEGRNAFTRLIEEIEKTSRGPVSLHANERVKFDGAEYARQESQTANNGKFDNHKSELASATVAENSLQDYRVTLLDSLAFEQMASRQSTIRNAYSTTCGWFLKHPAYVGWNDPQKLHDHGGFLWINGKPGAGKSTLMKFVHAHANKTRLENDVIVAFYFNARGDALEKSTVGMYRALIFDMLQKATDMHDILDDFQVLSEHVSQPSTWTIESLHKLFSMIVTRLGQQKRLRCFIDALDECDEEQVRDMVTFFEEVAHNAAETGTQLFICFASRHYPTIDISRGHKLILEDEAGHGDDLAKYVQSHLRTGKGKYIDEVKMEILQKANGVFIWAVLVIDILNEEFRRGRIFAVKKRLQEIPGKLSDLFKDVLRRDHTNMTDLLLCLQWILFAKRPLRREEFYFAMVTAIDPDPENLTEWSPDQITVDDMNRFVLNSSKGLAELTKSKVPTVQFIHESIRDFLIKDNGLCELWPELTVDLHGLSHDQLKRCCQTYLSVDLSHYEPSSDELPKAKSDSAKELRQILATKFPFLEYAHQCVLYHADEAAVKITQDGFLHSFPLPRWINISNLLAKFNTQRYTSEISLLYILAERGFARLIGSNSLDGGMIDECQQKLGAPLFAALTNSHRDAIRALLQREDFAQIEELVARLEFGQAYSAQKDRTPLLWAVSRGDEALAEILVRCARVTADKMEDRTWNLEAGDKLGRTALHLAVIGGLEKTVRLLLDHRADVRISDKNGKTALQYAANGANETITRLVLDKCVNIDGKDRYGKTLLMRMVEDGNGRIVQLLLKKGAKVEACDHGGRTSLVLATRNGREYIAQLLLENGAAIQDQDHAGKTPLIHAAENGNATVMQLLLQNGAQIEHQTQDSRRTTALLSAARCGKGEAVQLLLGKGANIEAKDQDGCTALTLAVQARSEIVVQLLLREGADIEARDKNGRTALSHAMNCGKRIVQTLLASNAQITSEDNEGRTPFFWIMTDLKTESKLALTHTGRDDQALQDYQMQLMMLEQSNKGRLLELRSGERLWASMGQTYPATSMVTTETLGELAEVTLLMLEEHDKSGTTRSEYRALALVWAAQYGWEEIATKMLSGRAYTETKMVGGKTPLLWAAAMGKVRIVEMLCDQGADLKAEDVTGHTALSWAVMSRNDSVQRLLVSKGADVEAQARKGRMPSEYVRLLREEQNQSLVLPHCTTETEDDFWEVADRYADSQHGSER